MEIIKVTLDGKEIPKEQAQKYILDYMTLEAFFGGIGIVTPDGLLIAEVRPL